MPELAHVMVDADVAMLEHGEDQWIDRVASTELSERPDTAV